MTSNTFERSLAGGEEPSAAVFDPAILVQRCAGDQTLAAELATLFVQNVDAMLAAVTGAVEAGDAVALERTAHALKGMVANFGITTAASLAGEMERLARSGHLENAGQLRPSLTDAIEALRRAVQQNFGR